MKKIKKEPTYGTPLWVNALPVFLEMEEAKKLMLKLHYELRSNINNTPLPIKIVK